ncbi:MAG: aquaporin [Firmicutes bacterium]|nr:aquaporin [Bacillota bacterium]
MVKKGLAECFGTFVLVFCAVGTAVVSGANLVGTALAFGLVIVAMAYTIGGVSGCHINPAVSLAMFLSKKISGKEFAVYALAQTIGAVIGATLLYSVVKASGAFDMGSAYFVWGTNAVTAGFGESAKAGGYFASIVLEIILTFIFIYTILVVAHKKDTKKTAGLIIGLTLTLVHLIGINLTGTSVNPARSFGVAVMAPAFGGGVSALEQVWVFIVAPLLGGLLASLAFKTFNAEKECECGCDCAKMPETLETKED